MSDGFAVEMRGITKTFGSVVANRDVDLDLRHGEILALLGENGSGKTTLMNMLSGIYAPDSGSIRVEGKPAVISSPQDAKRLGIGMVHQHFKLVDVLSAADNIWMGAEKAGALLRRDRYEKIAEVARRFGFDIDPRKQVANMAVSEKQTLEIIKVLYYGAKVIILDEPTAVLTVQEIDKLFSVLRRMKEEGHSIIIITHKLNEVLSLSDRVAVLRKGHSVGSIQTSEATEKSLTEMMVGRRVDLNIERPEPVNPRLKLKVRDVTVVNDEGREVLSHAAFEAYTGEILGVAGIAGSGQKELLEAIAGLQPLKSGSIEYTNRKGHVKELTRMTPEEIREIGIRLAFVPEDRLGMGLVASMGMTGNMMLRSYKRGRGFFSERKQPRTLAERIMRELDVVTPGVEWPVGRMSGGNVQKVLVGREIASSPQVLMVAYPVRGLDINSSHTIYRLLNEQKKNGSAVICVGEDLDVLLALCDRILVLADGHVSGTVDARDATKEQIGLMMTNHDAKEAQA